jgi:hypothetical protein
LVLDELIEKDIEAIKLKLNVFSEANEFAFFSDIFNSLSQYKDN